MVIVKFSDKQELVLPQWLGETLGLCEGDQVDVERHDDVVRVLLGPTSSEVQVSQGSLTDLAKIISSARPVGSVDIELYMDKHGYEQIYDGADS